MKTASQVEHYLAVPIRLTKQSDYPFLGHLLALCDDRTSQIIPIDIAPSEVSN